MTELRELVEQWREEANEVLGGSSRRQLNRCADQLEEALDEKPKRTNARVIEAGDDGAFTGVTD